MLTIENTQTWLTLFADKITDNAAYLSELDQAIGDGDHGSNMARGVEAMTQELNQATPETVADIFKPAAMSLISNIGGASGPLYGTALLEMSKQAAEDAEDLGALLQAGLAGIQKRGKAQLGDKTMIDVWSPVIEAVENSALNKETVYNAVEATKELKAEKGRAAYVGERSIGHLDPGAVSSGYFFEALIESGVLNG
ncbi:Phosphoenolpyruvate--glycerone phosphotransferase [Lentibacillus sp. JNUCC-1]|uniref:dihydroxyacetone kinase subunit DhaL n=1 Tax=Lentibacillus sp. JNUCC-1 TaxID=2654513 RepID=UPI0012E8FA5C|nr:dihydroxyacetone kinase subunit DhaL [Lentibacillus sp. JNUCC-1]MUV36818.1 Phosphoenolpyruvate--glycerone phosphotransferase [Lentibacillus sp. JNUCC-1]